MAAGIVQITVLDGSGTSRTTSMWSSDGTITGNLQPLIYAPELLTALQSAIPAGSNLIGSVTANLGALNGAATSALQATTNTALGTINTTLGSPLQAGGNVAVTALPALPAGANLIGQVQPAIIAPAVLTLGTAYNFSTAGNLRVQVDGLAAGDLINFAGSVASAGTTYPLQQILNCGTGAVTTTISANGVYQILFGGGLYITATKTGTAGSAQVITASASQ